MKVSDEHFGAIYTSFPQDTQFLAVMSEIGAHISRWPGGTLAELRTDVYDIGESIMLDPTSLYSDDPSRVRLSLDEVTPFTGNNDTINVIVPTYRYTGDIESGLADIELLLSNISQMDALHGSVVRLEIGNEYHAIEGFDAGNYGEIANSFISHIGNLDISGYNFDLEVSVQAGRSLQETTTIIDSLDDQSFEHIDAVNIHLLPINLRNLYLGGSDGDRVRELGEKLDSWDSMFEMLGLDTPERHLTAWTVGQAANSADEIDLNYQDYGKRGGVTMLALFGESLELGVSESSVWGVGVNNLNSLGTVDSDGEVVLSHSGAVFAELRNSVVDMELLDSFGDLEWYDSASIQFGYQAYWAPGHLVLYAASGQEGISATTNLASKVPGFDQHTARLIEAKSIGTDYADGYVPSGVAEDRLYEVSVVSDVGAEFVDSDVSDGWWGVQNLDQFQIVEASFSWRHAGSMDDDLIEGILLADELSGAGGNDTLRGAGGDDTLIGESGNDLIEGGLGNDILYGDDQLMAWMDFL